MNNLPSSKQLSFIECICEMLDIDCDVSNISKQEAHLFIQQHIQEYKFKCNQRALENEFSWCLND